MSLAGRPAPREDLDPLPGPGAYHRPPRPGEDQPAFTFGGRPEDGAGLGQAEEAPGPGAYSVYVLARIVRACSPWFALRTSHAARQEGSLTVTAPALMSCPWSTPQARTGFRARVHHGRPPLLPRPRARGGGAARAWRLRRIRLAARLPARPRLLHAGKAPRAAGPAQPRPRRTRPAVARWPRARLLAWHTASGPGYVRHLHACSLRLACIVVEQCGCSLFWGEIDSAACAMHIM